MLNINQEDMNKVTVPLDLTVKSIHFTRDPCTIKTIAIDFDGTCVEHMYPSVGQNAPDVVEVLQWLVGSGRLLMLNTVRGDPYLDAAVRWFSKNSIILHSIQIAPGQSTWSNSPKILADLYIDDRAFGAPLIKPVGFSSPVIDWKVVKNYFTTTPNTDSMEYISALNKH